MLDPDSTIRYPVKCRHPALSGIRVKFAGYLPDSTVTFLLQTSNGKLDCGLKKTNMFLVENSEINDKLYCIEHMLDQLYCLAKNVVFLTKK